MWCCEIIIYPSIIYCRLPTHSELGVPLSHLSGVKSGSSCTGRQFIIEASLWPLIKSSPLTASHLASPPRAPLHLLLIRDLYIGRPPAASASSHPPTCRSALFHGRVLFSLPPKVSAAKERVIKAFSLLERHPWGTFTLDLYRGIIAHRIFPFFVFP